MKMFNKRYITVQIFPDDAGRTWTIRLRYRFFTFLFYAGLIALLAVALTAAKITQIAGKVLTADHLALVNRQLTEKQEKIALLGRELTKISEQESRIQDIMRTFVAEKSPDSLPSKTKEAFSGFENNELSTYVSQVRAIERGKPSGSLNTRRDHVPDIWPVPGIISQPFIQGTAAENRHEGLDIIAESNALVTSAAKGIVIEAGWDADLGKYVKIDHDFQVQTVYGHLNRSFVRVGDHLEKGAGLGTVGNTGNSLGPHLHYEILVQGKSVDPRPYLK